MTRAGSEHSSIGSVVWFTGLPSSGKSRLAGRVRARLDHEGKACCVLDGDRIRELIKPTPGYSPHERDQFYQTLGGLAVELAEQGLIVLVPATAHRRAYRDQARERAGRFIEVWMMASLEECREHDRKKGLYAKYTAGEAHGVPGEDLAYEPPELPEVSARGGDDDQALLRVLQCLRGPVAARQT